MPEILRGRLPAVGAGLVAALVGLVLLVPVHPESGLLHLLGSILPAGAVSGGSPGWWTFEDLGNVALFVPVGAIGARYLRPVQAVVVGIGISALCETAQLAIPSRHASVQDVVLNGIGVAVGVACAALLRAAAARRQARAISPHSVQDQ